LNDARRYPWIVALVAMLTFTLVNGLTATGLSVYDPTLLDHFGWSRGELKFRDVLTFWVAGLLAPVVGVLADRINPRYLLSFGLSCLALGMYGYSVLEDGRSVPMLQVLALLALTALPWLLTLAIRMALPGIGRMKAAALPTLGALCAAGWYFSAGADVAIRQLYVIHLVISLAIVTSGGVVIVVLVSNWFVRHRGLGLGIALLGTSIGSALMPMLNVALQESFGWRTAFRIDALLTAGFAVVVLVVIRGMPRHSGMQAVGQDASAPDACEHGLTFGEAVRTKTFWAIAASGALAYYAIIAFVQHLVLHMNGGLGIPLPQVAWAFTLYSVLAMLAKLAGGALADRIDRKKVFLGCLTLLLVGMLMLATLRRDLLVPSIVAIGLGWGGLFTLYSMLAVTAFGLREFGRINGAIVLFENIGVGLGSWVTGRLYDAHGDYQVAFAVVAGAVVLALLAGTQVRREVPPGSSPAAGPSDPSAARAAEPPVVEKDSKLMA
jgi:sugar phosphate permease